MAFRGVEIKTTIDEKFRLIIPSELIEARNIGDFVELINSEVGGRFITRIYYHDSGIDEALKIRVRKGKNSSRVTLVKSLRERSDSFLFDGQVLIVDRGKYLEILPWPAC